MKNKSCHLTTFVFCVKYVRELTKVGGMGVEEKHIGKAIITLSHQIKRKMQGMNEAYGITGTQSRILHYIAMESEKRPVFQRDVEQEFDIRRSTATEILKILERKQLILRESVESDGRLKKLTLTEDARELEKGMCHRIKAMEQELSEKLTKEENTQLMYLLDKLQDRERK